ncbi:hypothetical protein ACU21_01530 [Actinobaculum suis]|uniref:hypothetical protein n=1 Tax=Actinobaculum suis TaxID=1657 RepID=UPI00080880DF|nr:hypothetical protein [Actinobaculum suis]OCA93155.1 hypothetical protein ACU21_01530 [Actinobaculum suis]
MLKGMEEWGLEFGACYNREADYWARFTDFDYFDIDGAGYFFTDFVWEASNASHDVTITVGDFTDQIGHYLEAEFATELATRWVDTLVRYGDLYSNLTAVNQARAERGLPRLEVDEEVISTAAYYCNIPKGQEEITYFTETLGCAYANQLQTA